MNGAFYVGATGLQAQQRVLDVTANNIANINTPGYKRSEARFSELMSSGMISGAQLDAASGVAVSISPKVFVQGELRDTGQPLDIAIKGDGFIEVLGPGGRTLLWRGGTLKVNEDGYLAAANGMPLKAMVSAPIGATALTITADGKVQAKVDGEALTDIGQIDLVTARDVSALSPVGEGLYAVQSDDQLMVAAPGQSGSGELVQGAIEASNVQLSDEMVGLLLTQRAYAANAQVIQAGDQLMAIANSLRR